MIADFTLVAAQRKAGLIFKLIVLALVLFGQAGGYVGMYIPIEVWQVLTVFLVISSFLDVVRFFTITAYRKRSLLPVGERDNFVLGIDSLFALIVFAVTVGSLFVVFNIAFQTFLTSISLFAVALVLIFRDYISNYLDSFRLMFTSDYRIGDYIKVNESSKGIVVDISFRATKIKTDEGDILFIPNTKLMTSEVVNYSKAKFKRITVPFSLPTQVVRSVVDFEDKIKTVLLAEFPDLVQKQKLFLRVNNIKDWQTDFSFEVSVDHYNFAVEERITRIVYEAVLSQAELDQTPPSVLLQSKPNV